MADADLGIYDFRPVTLHVHVLGDWSNRLAELAKSKDEVRVLIEGPYGSLSVDVSDDCGYQMVLRVSGGIDVTHCQSVAKSLIHEHKYGRRLKHLRFVWAVRDLSMLAVMPPLHNPSTVESGGGEYRTEIFEESSGHSSIDDGEENNENVKTDQPPKFYIPRFILLFHCRTML